MHVGLIGVGKTARALARGWADPVLVSDGVRPAFQDAFDPVVEWVR
jgi:hypothetical protein